MDDIPWDDYYGPGSPLERLVAAGGRVLRLGADLGTLTVLHHAEYLVALPEKRRVVRHRLVAGPDGPVVRTVSCLDDSDGIVAYPPVDHLDEDPPSEDYFEVILVDYLATGRAAVGLVGGARSELIDAGDVLAFGVDWMGRHLLVA